MKHCCVLLQICLFAAILGCGSASDTCEATTYHYNQSSVTWEGFAGDREDFGTLYSRVEYCLNISEDYPYIIILDEYSLNVDGVQVWGFVSNNKIFITKFSLNWYQGMPLAHEYVHYLTGKGNEIHGESYMIRCGTLTFK